MNTSRLLPVAALSVALALSTACGHKQAAHTNIPVPPTPPQTTPAASTPAPRTERAARTEAPAPSTERSRFPDAKTQARIDELLGRIQDAYFDYDAHHLRSDAETTLKADAKELGTILRDYPDYKLTVEGYCDERGSAEYNLALGDARARAAKEYLVALGIPGEQLNTVSFGKEKQTCAEHDEACWQKNRRVHIVAMNH